MPCLNPPIKVWISREESVQEGLRGIEQSARNALKTVIQKFCRGQASEATLELLNNIQYILDNVERAKPQSEILLRELQDMKETLEKDVKGVSTLCVKSRYVSNRCSCVNIPLNLSGSF